MVCAKGGPTMPNLRRAIVVRALLAFAAAVLVVLMAASSAGARADAWRKNTFHVTRAGVFHAYFPMPKWFEAEGFAIQIVGPSICVTARSTMRGLPTALGRSKPLTFTSCGR
jgi:hypothetical protein